MASQAQKPALQMQAYGSGGSTPREKSEKHLDRVQQDTAALRQQFENMLAVMRQQLQELQEEPAPATLL